MKEGYVPQEHEKRGAVRREFRCLQLHLLPSYTQLVAELFNESTRPESLSFDTDFAGAKLFQERVLRGRAVCTKANADGAYIFDEKTGLWKKDDKVMIRHLICSKFPAFSERANLSTRIWLNSLVRRESTRTWARLTAA